MLTDIFSSFDPAINTMTNSLSQHTLWLTPLISISSLAASYWITPSHTIWTATTLRSFIIQQLNQTQTRHILGITGIVSSLFTLLVILNLIGLLPYVFRLTRHIIYTARLGLPLWLTYILSSLKFDPTATLARLVPQGTPQWLRPFLSLVETTRTTSRPLTLSFRLAANIRAGHIVLILLGTYTSATLFQRPLTTALLTTTLTGYLLFEVAICTIQAYIFCLLLSLYANDHPLPNTN